MNQPLPECRIDRRDAFVIADTARMRRDALPPRRLKRRRPGEPGLCFATNLGCVSKRARGRS